MDFSEIFPELIKTFKNNSILQSQIHPIYNFNWTFASIKGLLFDYNISEIYFEKHASLDDKTKVTLMVGI